MVRYFQYKVEIILNDPLEKTKYYAKHIEFEERRSPHLRLFTFTIFQIFKIKLPTINAQLLDHLYDPGLFELINATYQVRAHARSMNDLTSMNIASMVDILLRRQLL